MPSYSEIQAQIAELKKQANEARKAEAASVIAQIRQSISDYGLKPSDLFPGIRADGAAPVRKAARIKYRDTAGNTWTGRGKMPRWLHSAIATGASLDSYLVKD